MMRRCFLESNRSVCRLTLQQVTTRGLSSSSRKGLSSPPAAPPPPPPPPGNASSTAAAGGAGGGGHAGKIIFGGALIGAAVAAAYKTGYLDQFNQIQEPPASAKEVQGLGETLVSDHPRVGDSNNHFEENVDTTPVTSEGENKLQGGPDETPLEDTISVQHKEEGPLPTSSPPIVPSDDHNSGFQTPPQDNETTSTHHIDAPTPLQTDPLTIHEPTSEQAHTSIVSSTQAAAQDLPPASLINDAKPSSLLDEYFLPEKDGDSKGTSLNVDVAGADGSVSHFKEKEDSVGLPEELKDAYISKDGKLVLDFLQAIHAAEKRQAELDAHILAEEKRILKEKYEKELKDARARELMYAEEAAILDKELIKERTKAAATLKLFHEKAEENMKMELERKNSEAELQLKKAQELAKAELTAAIAREKALQIEKMAEANLNINALCLAFYARSEEARQSHYVHKLALGSLALEDALSKGLPIKTEINALHNYLEGVDRDSLLDLVFSSLPEETVNNGSDTQLELNQKFDALKGTLRHFSLIPPGGGGIFTHSLAHVASWLKVKEDDISGDGIESTINRVERFLAEGKLAEAADALEGGVSGSQAEEIIHDWVRQVRNRAIAEQALSLLQSYAISTSAT